MQEYTKKHEKKILLVVFLTAITMIVEIFFGIVTKSMALLADGIHMGTHVFAIGLSWVAYFIVRKVSKNEKFNGNSDKILSLSGYTSGIILLIFAVIIMVEAVERIYNPLEIAYNQAILVAFIGLAVNIASAFLLHHNKEHGDYNIQAAYLHVIADAFTSFSAILGLTVALVWGIPFLDTLAAIISSLIIIKWSVSLLSDSGKSLLDIDQQKNKNS